MKRTPEKYPSIKKYKSFFFWKTCQKCYQEFRREPGWQIDGVSINLRVRYFLYVCQACCPNKEEANKAFNPPVIRPPPPPAPPPRASVILASHPYKITMPTEPVPPQMKAEKKK